MREAFEGNADIFYVFFKLCKRYNLGPDKEVERIELLRKLVAHNRIKYHRDGDALIKGKNIIHIKKEKSQ